MCEVGAGRRPELPGSAFLGQMLWLEGAGVRKSVAAIGPERVALAYDDWRSRRQ
jgi:hypothetical protein